MSKSPLHVIQAIEERKRKGLFRALNAEAEGVDFYSNDYLGFSKTGILSKKVQQQFPGMTTGGSGGSRLISGNSIFAEETEKKIADFHGGEAALIFNSGYDANLGLLSSVPQKNDLVITDELIHASVHDGVRLSYAKHYKFGHNDVNDLNDLLQRHAGSFESVYVVVESVYSMDGDEAPLREISNALKNYKNVYLIVDEAHAIGVFGKEGRGLCERLEDQCFARVYTFGKAMGCHGAAVVGGNALRNYLINFARSFIYTTALPPHAIAHISCAYDLLKETEQQLLQNVIGYFKEQTKNNASFIKSRSAIHCLVLGSNEKAAQAEDKLRQNGFLCKAVKSPTVKEGSERIRFCLHAFNTKEEIDKLVQYL